MKKYRVEGGVAKVGPGQVLELSGQQIKDRAYGLELPKGYQLHAKDPKTEKPPKPADAVVTATTSLEFKKGEVIGLEEVPVNLKGIVVPVDAPAPTLPLRAPPAAASSPPGRSSKK